MEVFDRPASFDPVVDPLVRIEAARLRDKLREYDEADGRSDPIHIELPKGSYTPHVEFRQSPTPERGPDRQGPVIAVFPFVNLSGDASQEYFSDGLTEDIMTELARVRDLRVLARNTTFQYKGKAVDVSKLGRELGVRYMLEGSVRRSGDDLRVTAQLIDAETGTHIWADKFDRKMADVFLVQDEIVGRIVAKIASGFGAIENTEAKSAARKSPEQIQAYDLVLRAHDVMRWDYSRANFRSAKNSLRQAIALDPLNARARRELAWLAALGWVYRFDETPVPPHEILEQATKAVQLDPSVGRARIVLARAYLLNSSPIGSSMNLMGSWRWIYVASSVIALYLNIFVGVVQTFLKVPFLNALAPTQSEPPFVIAQAAVLLVFAGFGFVALRSFHPRGEAATLRALTHQRS